MVTVLDSGSSGPGSGPGRGHCVVFLSKTGFTLMIGRNSEQETRLSHPDLIHMRARSRLQLHLTFSTAKKLLT